MADAGTEQLLGPFEGPHSHSKTALFALELAPVLVDRRRGTALVTDSINLLFFIPHLFHIHTSRLSDIAMPLTSHTRQREISVPNVIARQ